MRLQVGGLSEEAMRLRHLIDEPYTTYPFYGSRCIREQLQREGETINRKRVQRYRGELGIDITYVWTDEEWLCLTDFLDLYSGMIVSWSRSETMTAELLVAAFEDGAK